MRRQRRRGIGIGGKVLVVGVAVFAVLAIAVIGVASWVLDVAAKAPSLASCQPARPWRQLGPLRRRRQQARGDRLARSAQPGRDQADPARPPARDRRDRGPALLRTRRARHRGHPAGRGQRPRSRRSGRGRFDDHPATGPQPLHPPPERNLERKIIEAKLALEYAEKHSPEEILGQYLNIASYGTIEGATAVGVGAAARIYFSRPVWKLNLAQSALLAGLPQAPSEYNPLLNPGRALARRNEVLRKMAKLGYVSAERGAGRSGQRPRARRLRRLLQAPPALLLRLRAGQADRSTTASTRCAAAGSGCRRRSTPSCSGSAWKRCARRCPTPATRPRRWSRSIPATARSGRWSPAPTTPRASSTSPPRATASPARPSRRSS